MHLLRVQEQRHSLSRRHLALGHLGAGRALHRLRLCPQNSLVGRELRHMQKILENGHDGCVHAFLGILERARSYHKLGSDR